MIITRKWAMPNAKTFTVKPIKKLIERYYNPELVYINPFANESKYGITNDLNPRFNCDYNLEATEFLELFEPKTVDLVLYDPPYTPYQLKHMYEDITGGVNLLDTKNSYWSKQKDMIGDMVKNNGIVISCGYDSNGIGKTRGFKIIEILLVAHGGKHNDTIVTVERKLNQTTLMDYNNKKRRNEPS